MQNKILNPPPEMISELTDLQHELIGVKDKRSYTTATVSDTKRKQQRKQQRQARKQQRINRKVA